MPDPLVMVPAPAVPPSLTPLCELARKHQTDKGGWHLTYGGASSDTCHNYTPTYYALLKDKRESARHVLEIGVNAGSSLRMWEEFFPNAMIYGLDINSGCLFTAGRIRCEYADQGSAESLTEVMAKLGNVQFDLIVDDGSHQPGHQIVSANTLLPTLAPDGLYIIEDIGPDCRPEQIGVEIRPKDSHLYSLDFINVGIGIGKAHCDPGCTHCQGHEGERLIVYRRKP